MFALSLHEQNNACAMRYDLDVDIVSDLFEDVLDVLQSYGLASVPACGELFDGFAAKRAEVVRVTTAHEPSIAYDLLVNPVRSGVEQIRL